MLDEVDYFSTLESLLSRSKKKMHFAVITKIPNSLHANCSEKKNQSNLKHHSSSFSGRISHHQS